MSSVEKIFTLITQRGLKQKEVAKGADVSEALFSQWKKGQQNPSLPTLQKLAEYFDVPVSYFYVEDPEIKKEPSTIVKGSITEDTLTTLGFDLSELEKLTPQDISIVRSCIRAILDNKKNI